MHPQMKSSFSRWLFSTQSHYVKRISRPISSKQWQGRQSKDLYTKEAISKGLKSRAAFKLLQINDRYKIFKHGQTVVDLGYAPGSWSQVAVDQTQPHGRVIGVDMVPTQPPKGVSTIQGNFLSPRTQATLKEFLRDPQRGRSHPAQTTRRRILGSQFEAREKTYAAADGTSHEHIQGDAGNGQSNDTLGDGTVDVVLSDMLMNTSGTRLRDHAGSMELCGTALEFALHVLKRGGHFVCKFYQGQGEKEFEKRLKVLFYRVHREKPESSRNESREIYFVGLKRKPNALRPSCGLPPARNSINH